MAHHREAHRPDERRELLEGGGALSPARHVGGANPRGPSAVHEAMEALRLSARDRDVSERALREALAALDEA